jgi:hypothetical protein
MGSKAMTSLKTSKAIKAPAPKDALSAKPVVRDGKVLLGERELGQVNALNKAPTGTRGIFELGQPEFQPGRNKPICIGGRQFGGRALDQMQNRGIPPIVVENAIQTGRLVQSAKHSNRLEHHDAINDVKVVTEKGTGRVITVMFGAKK